MNQGELNMIQKKIARLNIKIFGIRELKGKRMGEFKSDEHYLLLWARIP